MSPRPASEIPGLRPIPFVGRHLGLLRLFRDPLRVLPRLWREHGEIAALSRGDPSIVCAFGPAFHQQLLPRAKEFEHLDDIPMRVPEGSALSRTLFNLTVINGADHRRQRRLMMPAFGRSVIHGYRDDMVELAGSRLARWRTGSQVDANREMTELTLDVMMRCLFGLSPGEDAAEVGRLGTSFLEHMTSPATAMLPLDLPWLPFGRFMRLCERFEERLIEMIEQRRASRDQAQDVLSLLIRAADEDGSRLTDRELLGNMGLLFVAGHETTAHALSWTLFLLAQHPQIQLELREELRGELHGDAPTVEQLARLPLLDAIVDESLRLLPPTYVLFIRRAMGEFELGPYRMPEGSLVVLSPLVAHHLPEVFEEPERFRPERWASRKPSPFELVPFGAGPRLCLGASFAAQEIRLVLAMIVQRHGLRMLPGSRVDPKARGITMGPRGGLPIELVDPDARPRPPVDVGGSIREWVQW